MFQLAAGYAFAKRHNRRLAVPGISEGQKPLQYYDTYFHQLAKYISPRVTGQRYIESMYSYWEIPDYAHDIYGYFQSSKYFTDISGEIRTLFDLPEEAKAEVERTWANVLVAKDRGIILDIRASAHEFLTQDYYERGVAAIREAVGDATVPVFVVSDDVVWMHRLPWLKEMGVTIVNETSEAAIMYIMSQFRRFVLSNTAFSWWGAWLSGDAEHVVVPDQWNRPRDPQDFQDVYETNWTRIPVQKST